MALQILVTVEASQQVGPLSDHRGHMDPGWRDQAPAELDRQKLYLMAGFTVIPHGEDGFLLTSGALAALS
jgi:hypothetical protein